MTITITTNRKPKRRPRYHYDPIDPIRAADSRSLWQRFRDWRDGREYPYCPPCPHCGSTATRRDGYDSTDYALGSVYQRTYKCNDCGQKWIAYYRDEFLTQM